MKFINILTKYFVPALNNHTPLFANPPWGGMREIIRGGILSFMADFLVPILAIVFIILGFVQIPGCVSEYRQGQGTEFWRKILFVVLTFIVGLGLGALWGLFSTSI